MGPGKEFDAIRLLMSRWGDLAVDIGDDAILDRTFCSLRVWAVVRPAEMRAWLGTLKDKELRESLTWLLEHPWGMEKAPKNDEK